MATAIEEDLRWLFVFLLQISGSSRLGMLLFFPALVDQPVDERCPLFAQCAVNANAAACASQSSLKLVDKAEIHICRTGYSRDP